MPLGSSLSASWLVGGDASAPTSPDPTALHRVDLQHCSVDGTGHLLGAIRLFAFVRMPRYHVVIGELLDSTGR